MEEITIINNDKQYNFGGLMRIALKEYCDKNNIELKNIINTNQFNEKDKCEFMMFLVIKEADAITMLDEDILENEEARIKHNNLFSRINNVINLYEHLKKKNNVDYNKFSEKYDDLLNLLFVYKEYVKYVTNKNSKKK